MAVAEADAARGRTRMRVQVPAKLLGEDALVQRVREGDVRAFEQLYERYSAKLLSYCRHMLGSREEAEDVVQFTFVAAHKELTEHDREIRIAPWLYTVARNRCFSVLRKRREVSASELIEPSHDGLSAEVEQREDVMHVMHDIANLPPEQRSALLLTELESLSHEEVAEVLGCDRKKVKSLVFQARTSLAATREARETPCQDVREQISMLHGGSLRRNNIRRHLNDCKSCSAFSDQVRAQRAAIAVMLPVAPAVTLKASILGAVAQATTIGGVAATGAASAGGLLAAGGAVGGGAAAGGAAAGSGSAGGGLLASIGAQTGATKLIVAGAVATTGVTGAVVVEKEVQKPPSRGNAVTERVQESGPPDNRSNVALDANLLAPMLGAQGSRPGPGGDANRRVLEPANANRGPSHSGGGPNHRPGDNAGPADREFAFSNDPQRLGGGPGQSGNQNLGRQPESEGRQIGGDGQGGGRQRNFNPKPSEPRNGGDGQQGGGNQGSGGGGAPRQPTQPSRPQTVGGQQGGGQQQPEPGGQQGGSGSGGGLDDGQLPGSNSGPRRPSGPVGGSSPSEPVE